MTTPPSLKVGDKIAIVSTARKVKYTEIQTSLEIIENWGFIAVVGKTVGLSHHQFAGTDQERARDLQQMLDDDTIRAIWCARGGYGTVRIIDLLNFSKFRKHPKWIIGYSDITVLHSHIHNFKIATMHAPMAFDLYKCSDTAFFGFKNTLKGELPEYAIPSSKQNRLGTAKGQLVGGNLSILYSLCGSASGMDMNGKILCIEDLDEYLYHIDRMLYNLKRNGYFQGLKGFIVGGMTKMHDNTIPFGKKYKKIILDVVAAYDFPVAFNFPMGHIEDNRPLIFGANIHLQVDQKEVIVTYE